MYEHSHKFYLWIDEQEYLKYIKSSLIPILEQIATSKRDITANYQKNYPHNYEEKEIPGNIVVLYWKDKATTYSKWKSYVISKDYISPYMDSSYSVVIELSLQDERKEPVALGNTEYNCGVDNYANKRNSCFIATKCGDNYYNHIIAIRPYFIQNSCSSSDKNEIELPKSRYGTINIKIAKEDLLRIKIAILEIKAGN